MRHPSVGHSRLINHNSTAQQISMSNKHEILTRHGFNLKWDPAYRFQTRTGKQRWVENFYFTGREVELVDFCTNNYDALKEASYTFTRPDYHTNNGRYRLSYYYDNPESNNVEAKPTVKTVESKTFEVKTVNRAEHNEAVLSIQRHMLSAVEALSKLRV